MVLCHQGQERLGVGRWSHLWQRALDVGQRASWPPDDCGKASLELTEAEDILEAGVDIMAQPPGKRLQNVNLLSGGEKTMTALALLVAVFQVRPSPFFLLDEVDAALDDANVGRFNQLIVEMAQQSQFLVITHNKRTIEVADVLYGVTMEQRGVSKLVSVVLS